MDYSWKASKEYIRQDIYRNIGHFSVKDLLKSLCTGTTVSLLVYFRLCQFFVNNKRGIGKTFLHSICYLRFKSIQRRCGIELNQRTCIGPGLRLPHGYGIVIHPMAVIGSNCELMQGVTIGNNILKDRDGVAVIGNNVMLCAGAKVIGAIHIGDDCIIGANAVVNKDIPAGSIAAGAPARVIKRNDNKSYLINM